MVTADRDSVRQPLVEPYGANCGKCVSSLQGKTSGATPVRFNMATPSLKIPFNALPEATRRRLADVLSGRDMLKPIWKDQYSPVMRIIGWTFLMLSAAVGVLMLAADRFGRPCGFAQSFPEGIGYAIALFVAGYCALAIVRTALLAKQLPYPRGRFLLPTDFVIANSDVIELLPLSTLIRVNTTHFMRNGIYSRSEMNFVFGGRTEIITVYRQSLTTETLNALDQARFQLSNALSLQDWQGASRFDPLLEIRATPLMTSVNDQKVAKERAERFEQHGTLARALPGLIRSPSIPALVLCLLAIPGLWARNRLSDQTAAAHLQAMASQPAPRLTTRGTSSEFFSLQTHEFECYERGGARASESASTWRPAYAFTTAARNNTATSYRAFLTAYPNAPQAAEARAAVHSVFEETRTSFMTQASTKDPNMPAFMTRLLTWLEANNSPPIPVLFEPPSTEELTNADTRIAGDLDHPVAPIAPYFTTQMNQGRESTVRRALQAGFASVFPGDVLQLGDADGQALSDQNDRLAAARRWATTSTTTPTASTALPPGARVNVRYTVRPSGSVYSNEAESRYFVGITVDFHVTMTTPDGDPLEFDLAVEPPQTFQVSTYGPGQADDGSVYSMMATRAFDELSLQFNLVFFRQDSPGHQRAQESLSRRHQENRPSL